MSDVPQISDAQLIKILDRMWLDEETSKLANDLSAARARIAIADEAALSWRAKARQQEFRAAILWQDLQIAHSRVDELREKLGETQSGEDADAKARRMAEPIRGAP